MRSLRKNAGHKIVSLALFLGLSVAAGSCAKSVDTVDTTKWGRSFEPNQDGSVRLDPSAQGGGRQADGTVPTSSNYVVPKASVGGAYHRTFSTSPSYRMTGGFHTR